MRKIGESDSKSKLINIKKYEKVIGIIGGITVILGFIYAGISCIYNFSYKKECETFYQVPGKYFNGSIVENVVFIVLLVILLFLAFAPMIMRRYTIKKGMGTKESLVYVIFLEVVLGMLAGVANINNLLFIMIKTKNDVVNNYIDAHAMPIFMVIIIMFIIVLLCITLWREISNIKSKVGRCVIMGAFLVAWIITSALMLFGIICKLGIGVKDITRYEFAEKDNQCYIVVSDYKDKKVAMKYDVVGEICYIDTQQYYLIDDQAVFSYINLKHPPKRKNID